MKISAKLYLLTASLLCVAMAMGGLGLYGMSIAVGGLETVYNDRVVPLKQIKEIADAYAVNIVDTTHKVRNGSLTTAQGLASLDEAEQKIRSNWQAYVATRLVPQEEALVKEIEPQIKQADQATAKLRALLQRGDNAEIAAFSAQALYPAIDPVSDSFSRLVSLQLDVAKQTYDDEIRHYQELRTTNLLILLIALVIGIGVSMFVVRRSVEAPIAQARQAAAAIAAGNLGEGIDASRNDEMGALLKSLEDMRQQLRQLVAHLKENAAGVSGASAQLSTASGEVAKAIALQSESAASMAAAVEQMTVSVNHVGDSAVEARQITQETGEQSATGNRVIQETVAEMQNISQVVAEASRTIQSMDANSQNIGGIVQVIREVAEQTNLLALNAAIEAARAGEQGRGFAVVADEVRKLAERTAQATTQIGNMIGDLQASAQAAVGTMAQVVGKVETGVVLANRTSESMLGINERAQQVVAVVNEISEALREQGVASNDIAINVERIAQMSEENSSATRSVADTARQLETLAADTERSVAIFRI
ncbi:methyl-accepting chemotaxis protein [Azonexus sp. R2A61]|uniref:methyl-accepting chemotaxis protein n=1 Tax=Azonexus sp. R2A61 TaxID=2744443 RepID=UPI001F16F5C8|nr:methyl-accepting chemotaxis protein [Azonexus sp. R2A61]